MALCGLNLSMAQSKNTAEQTAELKQRADECRLLNARATVTHQGRQATGQQLNDYEAHVIGQPKQ